MSYTTINQCANDPAFLDRVKAAVASELGTQDMAQEPMFYIEAFRWAVATASDVEAAYASALAANNPNPGGDEAVISDQMILSSVQAHWSVVFPVVPAR